MGGRITKSRAFLYGGEKIKIETKDEGKTIYLDFFVSYSPKEEKNSYMSDINKVKIRAHKLLEKKLSTNRIFGKDYILYMELPDSLTTARFGWTTNMNIQLYLTNPHKRAVDDFKKYFELPLNEILDLILRAFSPEFEVMPHKRKKSA